MARARLRVFGVVVLINVIVIYLINFSTINRNILSVRDHFERERSNMFDKKRRFNVYNFLNKTFQDSKSDETNGFTNRDRTSGNTDERMTVNSITELNGFTPVTIETTVQRRITKDTQPEDRRYTTSMSQTMTVTTEKTAIVTLNPETGDALRASQPVYVASYVMENEKLCSSVASLSALVIVHTNPKNFKFRDRIRDTWANNTYYSDLGTVRILFLLGLVRDITLQNGLEQEFSQHGDLLQGDFIDDYHNLTLKGVMAYKWLTDKCRNAQIVVKTDDDVVVNMRDVLTNIKSFKNRTISCAILHRSIIIRDIASKWYVKEKYFPRYAYYPDYCSGPLVIFSNDLIPDLYRSSLVTPFFWVDDVYLYGLVPGNLPKLTFNDIASRISYDGSCIFHLSCPYTAVFIHTRNLKQMFQIWNMMLNSYKPVQL